MVAQKRPLPQNPESHRSEVESNGNGEGGHGLSPPSSPKSEQEQEQVELVVQPERKAPEEKEEDEEEEKKRGENEELPPKDEQCDDLDNEEAESQSSPSAAAADDNGFILVRLAEIRKEVQCPICLGIIKKTRTVMECLHRFCRDCIDKSMRLGNNECPACRTHCASRRSLRDDPNYDSLIAALYPDIDKYEEEESAFQEEEKIRNRKIQTSIAATLRRQTEALGRKRPTRNFRRGRNRNYINFRGSQGSDDDEGLNANDWEREPILLDEPSPDVRPKRYKRSSAPRVSRSMATGDADTGCEGNEDGERETRSASPARAGNREVLVWGKGGARSQTRHGGSGGVNGKNVKGSRITKLVDYLHNYVENENELDMHLTLLPMDDQSIPALDRPYLCCRSTLSIRHICQFISLQTSVQAEEIEILVRKPRGQVPKLNKSDTGDCNDPSENEYQILGAHGSITDLNRCFSSSLGNMVLVYRTKPRD